MSTARWRLVWSPAWAIDVVDAGAGTVVVAAGGDRRVAVDGLAPDVTAEIASWPHAADVEPIRDDARTVADRLVELGALEVHGGPVVPIDVIGDGAAVGRLRDLLAGRGGGVAAVVVRTDANWPAPPPGLHLGVDLTHHHTVVLGPLVAPGVTTCLGCLDARARHLWGDPVVVASPGIQDHLATVADLVSIQLRLADRRTSPLVNATIAWDLERGTTDRQSVYKLVGCPTCDRSRAMGAVHLPWAPIRAVS